MLVFKRKYSTHTQRNAAFFGIFSIVSFLILMGLINGFLPDLMVQPVNEAWLGRYFVWGVLIMILDLMALVIGGNILARQGVISQPIRQMTEEEIEAYNLKYNTDFAFSKTKKGHYLTLLLSLTIPVILVVGSHLIYPGLNQGMTLALLGVGFLLMCKVFYGTIRKMMQAGGDAMTQVFVHAQEHIPETSIKIAGQEIEHSKATLSVSTGLKLEGKFRGHEFHLNYSVTGARYGGASSSGKLSLNLEGMPKINVSLSENKERVFRGENLDECFEKRFTLKGMTVEKLPEAFKKKTLESFRTLSLTFKDNSVTQSLSNIQIMPFYSGQGLILFLDFLIELAEDLKKVESK